MRGDVSVGRSYSVRVAIVGLGDIGAGDQPSDEEPASSPGTPTSHASALASLPEIEVVAAADVSPAARDRFDRNWRSRWPDIRIYSGHNELLESEAIDLLTVATPDHLHGQILVDTMRAGIRFIFAEKPLVTDLTEADHLIDVADRMGTAIQVNYTRRFRPEFLAAMNEVTSGSIGRLSQIVIRNGGPRAMLFRNTTHFIDLACYFARSDPRWVVADFDEGFGAYGRHYAGNGGTDASLEPGANIYVAYDDGIRAFISDRKDAHRDQTLLLIGDSGSASLASNGLIVASRDDQGVVERRIMPPAMVGGIRAGLQDLLRVRSSGGELTSPATSARNSVAIIEAALASQADGNNRVDVQPRPAPTPMPDAATVRASA